MSARRFKPYPAYKDSGVEWLGEIPAGWEVKRLRFVTDSNPVPSEVRGLPGETEVSFVPMEAVGEHGGLSLDATKQLADVKDGYTYFRDGDIVVAKITPCFENGKGALAAGLTNGIAFGTTELHVLRATERTDGRFLFYVTLSDAFRRLGEADMYGAGGQKRVSESFVRNFSPALPSVTEQRAIAAFLDRETARIDALVAKKERLIELLQEQHTALITRAVTKGLDPNVPMKVSGVEWLGEIPAHWDLRRIKYLLHTIIDTEHKTAPFYPDGEYLVARTTNIKRGQLVMNDAKFTDAAGFREWTRRGIPKPGDILFTREAPAGEACSVPEASPLCVGQRVVLFRVRHNLLNEHFAIHSLYSGIADEFIKLLSQGSTVPHFNMSDIGSIPLLVPPISEQATIVALLQEELAGIDALVAKVHEAIDRLKELRTALVSAAVTGKIDVREEVA